MLAAGLVLAEAASAQLASEETVRARPRPEYDPIGLPLPVGDPTVVGNTLLFPSLSVSGGFDDNVFLTEDDATADFFTTVAPELSAQTGDEVLRFALDLAAEARRYLQESDNDYLDANAAASVAAGVTEELELRAEGGWFRRHEDRGDQDIAGTETEITRFRAFEGGAGATYRLDDLQFLLEGDVSDLTFKEGGVVPNELRDRTVYETRGRVGYGVREGLQAFVESSYNWVRYSAERGSDGLLQDNQGWEVLTGLAYDLTGVTYAEIGLGYRSQSFDEPTYDNSSGLALGAEVVWNATELMTLTLGADRSVEQTSLSGPSSSVRTAVQLGLDYELRYDILLATGVGYVTNRFDNSNREDTDLSARLGLTYLINEYAAAEVEYTFRTRDSNAVRSDFTNNTVNLGVRLQY